MRWDGVCCVWRGQEGNTMSLFLTSLFFEEYDEEFINWMYGWIERYTQSVDGYIIGMSYAPMPPAEEWLIISTGRPANQWAIDK